MHKGYAKAILSVDGPPQTLLARLGQSGLPELDTEIVHVLKAIAGLPARDNPRGAAMLVKVGGLQVPFHCLSLTLHCLSLTFHCLPVTFHRFSAASLLFLDHLLHFLGHPLQASLQFAASVVLGEIVGADAAMQAGLELARELLRRFSADQHDQATLDDVVDSICILLERGAGPAQLVVLDCIGSIVSGCSESPQLIAGAATTIARLLSSNDEAVPTFLLGALKPSDSNRSRCCALLAQIASGGAAALQSLCDAGLLDKVLQDLRGSSDSRTVDLCQTLISRIFVGSDVLVPQPGDPVFVQEEEGKEGGQRAAVLLAQFFDGSVLVEFATTSVVEVVAAAVVVARDGAVRPGARVRAKKKPLGFGNFGSGWYCATVENENPDGTFVLSYDDEERQDPGATLDMIDPQSIVGSVAEVAAGSETTSEPVLMSMSKAQAWYRELLSALLTSAQRSSSEQKPLLQTAAMLVERAPPQLLDTKDRQLLLVVASSCRGVISDRASLSAMLYAIRLLTAVVVKTTISVESGQALETLRRTGLLSLVHGIGEDDGVELTATASAAGSKPGAVDAVSIAAHRLDDRVQSLARQLDETVGSVGGGRAASLKLLASKLKSNEDAALREFAQLCRCDGLTAFEIESAGIAEALVDVLCRDGSTPRVAELVKATGKDGMSALLATLQMLLADCAEIHKSLNLSKLPLSFLTEPVDVHLVACGGQCSSIKDKENTMVEPLVLGSKIKDHVLKTTRCIAPEWLKYCYEVVGCRIQMCPSETMSLQLLAEKWHRGTVVAFDEDTWLHNVGMEADGSVRTVSLQLIKHRVTHGQFIYATEPAPELDAQKASTMPAIQTPEIPARFDTDRTGGKASVNGQIVSFTGMSTALLAHQLGDGTGTWSVEFENLSSPDPRGGDQLLIGVATTMCNVNTFLGEAHGGFGIFAATGMIRMDGEWFSASESCRGFSRGDVMRVELDTHESVMSVYKNDVLAHVHRDIPTGCHFAVGGAQGGKARILSSTLSSNTTDLSDLVANARVLAIPPSSKLWRPGSVVNVDGDEACFISFDHLDGPCSSLPLSAIRVLNRRPRPRASARISSDPRHGSSGEVLSRTWSGLVEGEGDTDQVIVRIQPPLAAEDASLARALSANNLAVGQPPVRPELSVSLIMCGPEPSRMSAGLFGVTPPAGIASGVAASWDFRDNGGWRPLGTVADQQAVEMAYSSGEAELTISCGDWQYRVDLRAMQQVNTHTGKSREIRRKAPTAAAFSFSGPGLYRCVLPQGVSIRSEPSQNGSRQRGPSVGENITVLAAVDGLAGDLISTYLRLADGRGFCAAAAPGLGVFFEPAAAKPPAGHPFGHVTCADSSVEIRSEPAVAATAPEPEPEPDAMGFVEITAGMTLFEAMQLILKPGDDTRLPAGRRPYRIEFQISVLDAVTSSGVAETASGLHRAALGSALEAVTDVEAGESAVGGATFRACLKLLCLLWRDPAAQAVVDDPSAWRSSRLTTALNQQLADPIAIATMSLPSWCANLVRSAPFLFDLPARRELLAAGFGSSRAVLRAQQLEAAAEARPMQTKPGSLEPSRRRARAGGRALLVEQVTLPRDDGLLGAAMGLLAEHGRRRSRLEVILQGVGEVGVGSGVHTEFYSVCARCLRDEAENVSAPMWMSQSNGGSVGGYLDSGTFAGPGGLFPAPLGRGAPAAVVAASCAKFLFLGRLVAKVLVDDQLLPLPLHPAFWDAALGRLPASPSTLARFNMPGPSSVSAARWAAAAVASGCPPEKVAARAATDFHPFFVGLTVGEL